MIVYFEGICGVGKTTLIEKYPDKRTKKIPQFINCPGDLINDTVCMKNDELKSQLAFKNRDKIVLVDRGYLSTLIYGLVRYQVTSHRERFDYLMEWLFLNLGSKLIRPDIYVWIDASNEVCMRRVEADNRFLPNSYWYKDVDQARFWYRVLFNTLEKGIPLYELDGENSLEANINKLTKIINENTID